MRSFYIRANDYSGKGCRGGIGDTETSYSEYALEIGQNCTAELELLALCSVHDEVIALLEQSNEPLARLVLRAYSRNLLDLEAQYRKSAEEQEMQDAKQFTEE